MIQNNVFISGSIAADIEVRFSQAGKPWAVFPVKVRVGKKDEEKQVTVEVVAFGDMALDLADAVHVGSLVMLVCRISFEERAAKDGRLWPQTKLLLEDWAVRPEPKKVSGEEAPF